MKKENNETLNELTARFFDVQEATKIAADIAAGEKLLAAHPVPTPSHDVLAGIVRQMVIRGKRRRWIRYAVRRVAAAACIILITGIGITLLQQSNLQKARDAFWQDTSDSLDAQLTQFDQADNDSPVITLEVNGSDMSAVNDLTDELNEIKVTFWEG